MASFLSRMMAGMATRAAVPKSGLGMSTQGYTGSGSVGGPNGPKGRVMGSTRSLTYNSPGQPLPLDINAQSLAVENYLYSVYVMRCVRFLAETIAALPFVAGMDPFAPADYNTSAPLARLLGPSTPDAPGGPNPHLASRAFWAWTIVQYIVTGRWGWEKQWDGVPGRSDIVGLWPLIASALAPIPLDGRTDLWAAFQYETPTGVIKMAKDKVLYCWRPSIQDWRMPESVLTSAAVPIQIQRQIDTYHRNLLKNNMVATTLVVAPDFEEADQRRAFEDQFLAEMTGVDKVGQTVFSYYEEDSPATGGKTGANWIQVEKLAMTATDAQLLEVLRESKSDINIALGVPKSLLGDACLKSDEWVRLADGSRQRAADLVGKTFRVLTSTPKGPAERDAYASWNAVEPTYEVVTESGRRLACNARHPLYAAAYTSSRDYVGGSHKGPRIDVRGWTRLSELKPGDLLAVATEFPTDGQPYDLDAARILGHLVGDGYCGLSKGDGYIALCTPDSPQSADFIKSVNALGDEVNEYVPQGARTIPMWGVRGGAVRKLLKAEGLLGSRAHDKHIPASIFGATQDAQREFLSRLYSADGCASLGYVGRGRDSRGHKSYGTACITLSTVSQRLACDVQELLLRFGIASRIESQWSSTSGIVKTQSLIYHVQITVAEDVIRFADNIGIFGKEEAVERCRAHATEQLGRGRTPKWRTRMLNPGLRWERIDAIEPLGVDATVAVTVPDGNTYLGTFWEHNSQRIYSNSSQEYRNVWTVTLLNLIGEIQDHVNLRLAAEVGSEVGWFDLSRVAALQPENPIFAPPDIMEAIQAGVATAEQVAMVLNLPQPGDFGGSDVETAMIGEEAEGSGMSSMGRSWGERADPRWWVERPDQLRLFVAAHSRQPMNSYVYERPDMRSHRPKPEALRRARIRVSSFDRAHRIHERAEGLRAVAVASRTRDKVYRYLAKNYEAHTIQWAKDAEWSGPRKVDLDDIQMARRPGGRDMPKVEGIAKALTEDPDGPAGEPVVLVKTPGSDKLKVADGYHRTLAHKRLGHDKVDAYVAEVDDDEGPWDTEMHAHKKNRWDVELQTRVGWYGSGTSYVPSAGSLDPIPVHEAESILTERPEEETEDEDEFNGVPLHKIDGLETLIGAP